MFMFGVVPFLHIFKKSGPLHLLFLTKLSVDYEESKNYHSLLIATKRIEFVLFFGIFGYVKSIASSNKFSGNTLDVE